uniref:Venom peptide n=1 Tax=Dasymutilla klugii TaxID=1175364 RepID=A0A8T9VUG4_DASKL|nr:venom peptide precursor [Dasymutilla klugii]
MSLGILSYVFMVIVIMAFSNIAESSAEPWKHPVCGLFPKAPMCSVRAE